MRISASKKGKTFNEEQKKSLSDCLKNYWAMRDSHKTNIIDYEKHKGKKKR